MKDWFSRFFSVSNEINENTVVGTILLVCFIIALFIGITEEKFYTLAGTMVLCYGFGALKK